MIDVARLLKAVGFIFIIFAVILKLGGASVFVGRMGFRLVTFLILANTCFILSLLYRK